MGCGNSKEKLKQVEQENTEKVVPSDKKAFGRRQTVSQTIINFTKQNPE